jgi:hypothetical protein
VQRDDPILDRLARDPLLDLRGDLRAPVGHLLQRSGRLQLRVSGAPTRSTASDRREPTGLLDRVLQQLAGLAGQLQHLALGLEGRRIVRSL